MRTLTLYSAMLSTLLSAMGMMATSAHAESRAVSPNDSSRYHRDYGSRHDRRRDDSPRADHYRDYGSRIDRQRDYSPRADRRRDHDSRDDHRRDDYRYDSHRRYIPSYRYYSEPYYGKLWYKYPRYYYYPRYRGYDVDDDFWGWLAFTAITLAIINSLNEQQQREHELALQEALRAPIGETIYWEDRDASGSVTMIRDGTSSVGRYCREYTQKINIGGESQQAYGTACRNQDGSWEIRN